MTQRNGRVLPTEAIIFHTLIAFLVLSIIVLRSSDVIPVVGTLSYAGFALLIYWYVAIRLKKRKVLQRWWVKHVINPDANRISMAIVIYALDLSHALLLFGAWFIFAGNLLFSLNGHSTTNQWLRAIAYAVQCAGIKTNREYSAPENLGVILTIITSLLGLVFAAVWVAVFMSAFGIVFKKPEKPKHKKQSQITRSGERPS